MGEVGGTSGGIIWSNLTAQASSAWSTRHRVVSRWFCNPILLLLVHFQVKIPQNWFVCLLSIKLTSGDTTNNLRKGVYPANLKIELAGLCFSLIPELQEPMGQSSRSSDDPAGYLGDYSHLTGHLLKPGLHPKISVKLFHWEMFSKALAPFFFKSCLYWGFVTETFTAKWAAVQWLVLPPQGIWFGCSVRAQWPGDSSGRGTALSELWSCSHCVFCSPRAGLRRGSDSATEETLQQAELVLCYSQEQPKLDM